MRAPAVVSHRHRMLATSLLLHKSTAGGDRVTTAATTSGEADVRVNFRNSVGVRRGLSAAQNPVHQSALAR